MTTSQTNSQILDQHFLTGCEEGNAYVFRDAQRNGRWCVYFTNKIKKSRHRIVLKEKDGRRPHPNIDGLTDALRLGVSTYFEMKNKTDRGEKIKSLTIRKMTDMYLEEEKKRVNTTPHSGIVPDRWYLLTRELNHYLAFVKEKEWGLGKSDLSAIHLMDINHLDGYFTYRRNTTNRKDKRGLPLPRKSTINHEIYTIRRAYEIIGISKRYINRNQKPLKPKANMRISTKETQDVRQSMFDTTEWQALLTAGKHWYAKGLSRFDRNGDLLGFEEYKKDCKGGKKGELNYNKPIRRSVIFGDSKSARAIAQLVHREMLYLAMRIKMETGLRIGTLKQLKWSNIRDIPKRTKEDPNIWREIRIQSEQGKTGNYYEIPAPITNYCNSLKRISKYTKPDDYIFCNQTNGNLWSERIWEDGLTDLCIEADLADLNKEAVNKAKIVKNGKDLTWYSFRHSFITWRLDAGVPIQEIANHCDTSIEYIQKHYYHPDLMSPKSISNLVMGRHPKIFQKF